MNENNEKIIGRCKNMQNLTLYDYYFISENIEPIS